MIWGKSWIIEVFEVISTCFSVFNVIFDPSGLKRNHNRFETVAKPADKVEDIDWEIKLTSVSFNPEIDWTLQQG